MSEHTPGPWKVFRGSRHQTDRNYMAVIDSIPDVDGKVVANCICHIASTNEDAEANAKLIAAAPELADALRDLYDFANAAAPELADALRDLYDFANDSWYSQSAFDALVDKAAELLRRVGK